jgi:hypothetical protein
VTRTQAVKLIQFAGYHDDRATFTRLYIENGVSYENAKLAYARGRDARARGVKCGCNDCNKLKDSRAQACVWGGCNGTVSSDGRCDRCGSKRP